VAAQVGYLLFEPGETLVERVHGVTDRVELLESDLEDLLFLGCLSGAGISVISAYGPPAWRRDRTARRPRVLSRVPSQ
jgi:hypothetical protein